MVFFFYSQICMVNLNVISHLCCNIPMTKRNTSCFCPFPSSFFSNEFIHPQNFLFHGFLLLMAILFFSRLNIVLNQSSCVSQGCNNRNKTQFMSYPCLFFQMNLVVALFFFFFGSWFSIIHDSACSNQMFSTILCVVAFQWQNET